MCIVIMPDLRETEFQNASLKIDAITNNHSHQNSMEQKYSQINKSNEETSNQIFRILQEMN
jgi:hypothetical protein